VQKTKSSIAWNAWAESNPGMIRRNNEDRIVCDSERGVFVVADGMGGEAAGEVAAQQAVDFVKRRLSEETGSIPRRLREAIAGANNEIYRLAQRNPQWRGMACVLTAAVVDDGVLHIGHVGDSRLYRVQANAIRKITRDHSPVGQKEDAGELTELEAMRHPRRNEVFRDVGSQIHKPDDEGFIEYLQIPFDRDAAYLICSDGLSDMLTSREIMSTLLDSAGRPRDSVRRLIEKANAAGGKDNVSVIVIESKSFAASAHKFRNAPSGAPSGNARPGLPLLLGRWAFLVYGLVAGLLAAYLWLRPVKTEPVQPDNSSSVASTSVLRVEPLSIEYPTITKALEAARAGDRIEVADGEYEELIRLKDGVDVVARTPGKAILHITRALPGADAAVTVDGVKRALFSGLAIQADPVAGLPFGIRISGSNVCIVNVEVSGATRAGIIVDGNSGSLIAASYIHANAGSGIVTTGTASPKMIGNLLYANGTFRPQTHPGLYITGSSNPEVKRNTFSGNGAEAIRVQRQELKQELKDNLFVNSGRNPIVVERNHP
jgi:PPM family protein phosphatase